MCFYYLFHRKKMNELEKNPEKYINALFHFLEEKGFKKSHHQINSESCFSYEKDDFHFTIDYDCFMKMNYVHFDIYYKIWDDAPVIQHLYIKDKQYESRFRDYDHLDCKEKLNLVAEYLSEHLEDVIQANIRNHKD